jgi:uncharacterized membrane protein YphA (DoxX/SURF4 family)
MLSFLLILEIAARLVLSSVFAVSGATKLRQRESFQRTLSDFGVPSVVVAALALVLPWLMIDHICSQEMPRRSPGT